MFSEVDPGVRSEESEEDKEGREVGVREKEDAGQGKEDNPSSMNAGEGGSIYFFNEISMVLFPGPVLKINHSD